MELWYCFLYRDQCCLYLFRVEQSYFWVKEYDKDYQTIKYDFQVVFTIAIRYLKPIYALIDK